jgi:DNA-nicking Smr family endonuclease
VSADLPPDPDHEPEPVRIPITGELDLHLFRPSEVSSLLPEYFRECRRLGILTVRVVHGKGSGTLRAGVRQLLEREPSVIRFRTGREDEGSWGATVVSLLPWNRDEEDCTS